MPPFRAPPDRRIQQIAAFQRPRPSGPAYLHLEARHGAQGRRADCQPRTALRYQSGLAPENLTTFAHFSVSSAINFPNSPGELANSPPPRSASCALILGSARPALISLFSLS